MTYVLCTACLVKLKPPPRSACLSIVPALVECEGCRKEPATSEFNGNLVDLMHQRHREAIEAGYKTYAVIEYNGGDCGVRIQVTGGDLVDEEARMGLSGLAEKAMVMVQLSKYRNDPKEKELGEQVVQSLIACFGDHPCHIYERLPNQYSNAPHNYYNPWLVVMTLAGPITIGWRKRVIEIRWPDAKLIDRESVFLFQGEDTTRFDRVIHAWGYPKAKEYINKLLTEGVWTDKQRELVGAHGTPAVFRQKLNECFDITAEEREAAASKYDKEFAEAGKR